MSAINEKTSTDMASMGGSTASTQQLYALLSNGLFILEELPEGELRQKVHLHLYTVLDPLLEKCGDDVDRFLGLMGGLVKSHRLMFADRPDKSLTIEEVAGRFLGKV